MDRAHVFNLQGSYTLPVGKGHAIGGNMPRWANTLIGGWDLGGLAIWESGAAITAGSARFTNVSYNTRLVAELLAARATSVPSLAKSTTTTACTSSIPT